jgi:hypothetical protein
MRKPLIVGVVLVAAALAAAAAYLLYAANEISTGRMGAAEITLPSGKTVWLRRQSYAHTPDHLYISGNDDYCAPYSVWHDYKLSPPITGDAASPVIVSFDGDAIVVHAPDKPRFPWLAPISLKVEFQRVTPSEYAAYVARASDSDGLPAGWQRIEVPFGHNTCSM